MRISTLVLFLFLLTTRFAIGQDAECADPNAELRLDHPDCVLTCSKHSLLENPASCQQNQTLKEDCYCKQNFYLEERSKKCVEIRNCPCNASNHETSRYSNECGNNCVTFHTRDFCSKLMNSNCWCDSEYCRVPNGTCIRKDNST